MNSLLPLPVQTKLKKARQLKQVIVLATGVFDLFHVEHQQFLTKAKQVGDFLIVGIESDQRVRQLKGLNRPKQPQNQRLQQVLDHFSVDTAFILPSHFSSPKDHSSLIQSISPHILAVSSHSPHLQKKREILSKHGGRVEVVHHFNPKISTTRLLASSPTNQT